MWFSKLVSKGVGSMAPAPHSKKSYVDKYGQPVPEEAPCHHNQVRFIGSKGTQVYALVWVDYGHPKSKGHRVKCKMAKERFHMQETTRARLKVLHDQLTSKLGVCMEFEVCMHACMHACRCEGYMSDSKPQHYERKKCWNDCSKVPFAEAFTEAFTKETRALKGEGTT